MIAATPEPGAFFFEYADAGFCNGGLHQRTSRWRHGAVFKLTARGENVPTDIGEHLPSVASRIRYVKIDVEGYALQVLESLKDLIGRNKSFIKVEVFKRLTLAQRQRLSLLLEEHGYDVFLAESDVLRIWAGSLTASI